jgi:putative membrane protein
MKAQGIVLALVLAVPAAAGYAAAGKVSHQDKLWLTGAHQVNLAEIKAGKTASGKGNSAIVRKTGRMLVSDHKMLDSALKRAARELGVSLPHSPSKAQQQLLQKIGSKSGAQFDKMWTKKMVAAHLRAINKTEFEINHSQSEKVKKLAKKALPALQVHLNMLKHAQNKLK